MENNKVHILDHPLIRHKLAIIRNKETDTKQFREIIKELATLMAYESFKDVPTQQIEVETPLEKTVQTVVKENSISIVPILACGGKGVISVLSNVVPAETSLMCKKFFAGDVKGAMDMQKKYLPLTNALFCEVNPIPVKAAAAAMGYGENYVRLPLVTMEETARQHLLECMREVGVKV